MLVTDGPMLIRYVRPFSSPGVKLSTNSLPATLAELVETPEYAAKAGAAQVACSRVIPEPLGERGATSNPMRTEVMPPWCGSLFRSGRRLVSQTPGACRLVRRLTAVVTVAAG